MTENCLINSVLKVFADEKLMLSLKVMISPKQLLAKKCSLLKSINLNQMTKILDMTKLKAFADDKINVAEMTISLSDRVENNVGKGENAGYQHFLLFPQCFPKLSSLTLYQMIKFWACPN